MSELKEKNVIGVNVTPTNATLSTEHFKLPIFTASDKPKWLVDWNNSMSEIDRIMYEIQTQGTVNENSIASLTQSLEQANTAITNLQTSTQNLSERLTNLTDTTTSQGNDIETIKSDLIAQNALIKTMQTTINNMDGQIDSLQSTADLTEQEITNLKTSVNDLYNKTSINESVSGYMVRLIPQISSDLPSVTIRKNKDHFNFLVVLTREDSGVQCSLVYSTENLAEMFVRDMISGSSGGPYNVRIEKTGANDAYTKISVESTGGQWDICVNVIALQKY